MRILGCFWTKKKEKWRYTCVRKDREINGLKANLKVIASIEERLEAINKSQKSIKEQKTGLLKTMQDQRDDHQKDIDEVTAKTGEIMELEAQLDKEVSLIVWMLKCIKFFMAIRLKTQRASKKHVCKER